MLVWLVELTLCCGLAIWLGGAVERLGAAFIFIGWVLSYLLQSRTTESPGIGVVIVDIVALIAFVILSAKSRRPWTLFAVACQFEAVVSHFARNFSDDGLFSYITALGLWSGDALVVCVVAGVVGHQLRLRRQGRMESSGAKSSHLRPPHPARTET